MTKGQLNTKLETRVYLIDFNDMVTAGGANLTGTVKLDTLPVGARVMGSVIKHYQQSAGVTTLTVSIGDSGSATRYAAAATISGSVADGTRQETSVFASGSENAAYDVNAYFTSTGTNLNTLSAGKVELQLVIANNISPSAVSTKS